MTLEDRASAAAVPQDEQKIVAVALAWPDMGQGLSLQLAQ